MSMIELDPRLLADSALICDLLLCQVRLMNDSRWPWLLLIPKVTEEPVTEIFQLSEDHQQQLVKEISIVSKALKEHCQCAKINVAAIGNMVEQLHIHIVARNPDDENWPKPVWGYKKAIPYQLCALEQVILSLRPQLLHLY